MGNRCTFGGVLSLMTTLTRAATLLVVLIMTMAACGAGPEPSTGDVTTTTTTTTPESTTTAETGSTTTMPPLDPGQLAIVEAAKADLAQRLRVEPEEVVVVSFQEVTWPDGSLGCPQPGMSYTQALVEGHRVALRHDDRFFDYHGAADEDPFLCPSDEKDGGHEFVPAPGFNE